MINSKKYKLIEECWRDLEHSQQPVPRLTRRNVAHIVNVIMKESGGTEKPDLLVDQIHDTYYRLYG